MAPAVLYLILRLLQLTCISATSTTVNSALFICGNLQSTNVQKQVTWDKIKILNFVTVPSSLKLFVKECIF